MFEDMNAIYATIMIASGLFMLFQMFMMNANGAFYVIVYKLVPFLLGSTAVLAGFKMLGIL